MKNKFFNLFIFIILLQIISLNCNNNPILHKKQPRYCKYYKYNKISVKGITSHSKVFYYILNEFWEEDSLLRISSYLLPEFNINNEINSQIFSEFKDHQEDLSKRDFVLNFEKNIKNKGQYNLIHVNWIMSYGNNDSIAMYIFKYFSNDNEYDSNGYLFYSNEFGILGIYSIEWDNLLLLDSIFGNKNYKLDHFSENSIIALLKYI